MASASRRRDEAGTTLVELLMTVVILGIAFAVFLGGMTSSIAGSDIHRAQASAETIMRSYAESVKTQTYVNCAGTGTYTYTAPTGFTATVTDVRYGSNDSMSFIPGCGPDRGLQRITLNVSANSGRDSETLEMVKRRPT